MLLLIEDFKICQILKANCTHAATLRQHVYHATVDITACIPGLGSVGLVEERLAIRRFRGGLLEQSSTR